MMRTARLPSPLWGGRTRPQAEPGGGVGASISEGSTGTPTPALRSASARPSPQGGGRALLAALAALCLGLAPALAQPAPVETPFFADKVAAGDLPPVAE